MKKSVLVVNPLMIVLLLVVFFNQPNDLTVKTDYSSYLQTTTTTTINYEYDALYRLTEANYSTGDYYHYAYDAVGNRFTESTQYSVNSYQYNGLGDRLVQNGTQYTLDLNAGLTQVLDDGTNTYTYGLGRISQTNVTTEYFLGDALGSVRQLTNVNGDITLAKNYDPYGKVTQTAGSGQSIYAYTGEQSDSTGLTYLRARYYNSNDGRFINRDTFPGYLTLSQSQNRFIYVENNPIRFRDPTGHYSLDDFINEAQSLINDPVQHTLDQIQKNRNLPFECMDVGQIVQWAAPALAPLIVVAAIPIILVSPDSILDLGFMAYDLAVGDYQAFYLDAMALMIPGVTGLGMLSKADKAYDTLRFVNNEDNLVGIIVRKRLTLGAQDYGHFAVYTKIGDNLKVRGFWPQNEYLPDNPNSLFQLLANNYVPGRVQNDIRMLDEINMDGVVHAFRRTTLEDTKKLRSLLGESGPSDVYYSFNPDNFENTYNCVTWGCNNLNKVVTPSIPSVKQGRVSKIFDVISNLPSPWTVVLGGE